MKVQKTAGAFSTMSVNLERQSPSGVFLRDKIIFDFFWQGARRSVCNTRTCAQKISYFYVFLEKDRLSLSSQGKICFRKKKTSFQIIQERSCPGEVPFERTIFSEHLKKISYFRVFFWERSSFIFRLRGKIIFSGKRNIIFPNNTKKIIFPNNLLRKPIFSGLLKKENMVSAQWKFSV